MKNTTLYLFIAYVVAGCGYHCFDRDLYKPNAPSSSKVKVSIEEFDLTIGALINLGEVASLRISECGMKPNQERIEPEKLCLTVRLDETHTFQFIDAKIEVHSNPSNSQALSMSDLEFMIFTSFKPDGANESDSSSAPPTKAPLKLRTERYGTGQHDYYAFEPSALFVGAYSTFSPPAARAFSKDIKRRPYTTFVQLPSNLGKQFYVKLPAVLVDGREYQLPTLEFNYSRESICYGAA